ncbi:uncharacterized protein LOC133785456 [Humulus lupulus]|uniref:uncharacterized protein LOC133785456 n=1 Tax=Humulus lupulus TaxID=3486 RepID=UPI002B401B65|nr:uncharacterized protein LOC133785456 [Humulus lupulus]
MVHTRFSSASPASQTNIPTSKSNMKSAVASVSEARVKKRLYNCKHEARKAKRTKKIQLIIEEPCESAPKGMNFLIHPDNHCSSKIASTIKHSQIQAIHEKLSTKQVSDFGDSCFGHFLTLPEFTMQHQRIHNLLLRELQQPNKLEIWVGVNGMKLRFGMREFALVTGLQCLGSIDKMKYVSKDDGLYSTYFKDHSKINKKVLKEFFDGKNWKNDEDVLKISLMHFLHNFLLSSFDTNIVPKEDFNIIDSGEFSKFPWGKEVFKATVESLKKRIVGKNRSIPRIVKWSSNIQPSFSEVTELLSLNVAELKLRNIYPTSKERKNSEIKTLFPKEKEAIEVDIGVPDNARVAHGRRSTNSRVIALGDDDFVETPPRFVASGSSPSLPAIHSHSDVGGCSSPTSEMPHVSLSSMHALLRALEACTVASFRSMQQEIRIKQHKIRSKQQEIRREPQDWKQDSHDIEEDNTNIIDEEIVENNSKEEGEKEEDESEEEEVHQFEDNDESDDDEDNAKCVGEDNDDEEKEKDDNHEKYNGGNKDEDSKVDDSHGTCQVPSQVAQVDEVASHVAGEVVEGATPLADIFEVDFQVAKVAGVATEVAGEAAEAVAEYPKVSFLDSLSDTELDKAIQNAYKAIDAMKETGVTPIPCTTIIPYVGSSESNLGYVTPALPKRTIKLPPCLQSPFLQTFCSSSGESSVIQSTGLIKVVKGLCPLDDKIGELTDFVIVQEFYHVDVVFYYLRKKGMYRDSTVLKFTTTDTTFQKRIEVIYDSFLKKNRDHEVMNCNHVVAEVMMGFGLSRNKSWLQVDHDLFPILVKNENHWLLAILSFKDRLIHVYNTFSCDRKDHVALLTIEPFCVLLPTYLSIIGFYERTDIDFSSKPYVGRPQAGSFEVVMDDDIPSGSPIDSAIYMFSFAEYFIGGKEIPRCDFDVECHRSRLAYLLYSYAMGKQECGYESAREYACRD